MAGFQVTHPHHTTRAVASRKVKARLERECRSRWYLGDCLAWDGCGGVAKNAFFDAEVTVDDETVTVTGKPGRLVRALTAKAAGLVRGILEEEFPAEAKRPSRSA